MINKIHSTGHHIFKAQIVSSDNLHNSEHDLVSIYLFETYHPGEQPTAESTAESVNAIFCNYYQKKGHKVKFCKKKISDERNKKRKTSNGSSADSSQDFSVKRGRFPCCICKAKDHRTHECPRMPEVHKYLADSDRSVDNKKPAWGHEEFPTTKMLRLY
jgi:hypothetical protein